MDRGEQRFTNRIGPVNRQPFEVSIPAQSLLDRVEVPLGFRWFGADPQRGFFLNGQPHPLHGTNRHQDLAGRGNALSDAEHRRDVRLVKETGFNFLRLAHYPQDPAVLEETDALGLAVWEEIPVVNLITPSQRFADNAERMLVEGGRRRRQRREERDRVAATIILQTWLDAQR
jgi:beta-galactosidase/beta-glucuronidase